MISVKNAPMKVIVRGNSVAAWCCARILQEAGMKPALELTGRSRLPAIMLSENALSLIRDVFGQPALFRTAPRITRRIVKWGPDAEPRALDHEAIVVSEQELLAGLQQGIDLPDPGERADFTIYASRPLPGETVEHTFGSRIASAIGVQLKDAADSSSCWIESLEEGWLFLIPTAVDSAWLLSVGCPPESILDRSRVIAERIASMDGAAGAFPASPRILSPLCGPGWLACGTAGMAFDPICGDGTAHAIREAILAAAVVQAIAGGGNEASLLSHYESRLTVGFQRHLASCVDFYRSGGSGTWWDHELDALYRGLQWCSARMEHRGKFRYQLIGFELKEVAPGPV